MGKLVSFPGGSGSRRVPTYDCEGNRIRDYSEGAVRELVARGRMFCLTNRREQILFAQFLPSKPSWRPASKPLFKLVSCETRLPGVEACAALFAVPLEEAAAQLERFQRAIYSQAVLCCQTQRAKVIAIDTHPRFERPEEPEERGA